MAMGRPPKEFNWERFDYLCSLPPNVISQEDIASILKLDVDTCVNKLKDRFGDQFTFSGYREQKHSDFREELLEYQVKSAKRGNATMQIWLGKQYLKQTDKNEISIPKAEIVLKYKT